MADHTRAVFPLKSVLFPGATMQLVIFEPRYLDMVSHCMSHKVPFLISRITDGEEAGSPAQFEKVGTLAHIIDFNSREDRLLTITVEGGERVCIMHSLVDDNHLTLTNDYRILPPVEDILLPLEMSALRDLLVKLSRLPEAGIKLEHYHLNSAEYIVHQLAQILPLPEEFKQLLLEENDSYEKCIVLYEQLLADAEEDR